MAHYTNTEHFSCRFFFILLRLNPVINKQLTK